MQNNAPTSCLRGRSTSRRVCTPPRQVNAGNASNNSIGRQKQYPLQALQKQQEEKEEDKERAQQDRLEREKHRIQ
jgi:hypothetical protein